jgi:DNA polymerase-3 subunit alpha
MQNYTVYHLHTELSLLDSCTNFKLYVDRAKELGQTAICFTEHGNCYNWIEKKEYCEEQGIKYLHGVEVYLTKELYEYPEAPDEWYESHLGCDEKETQEELSEFLEENKKKVRDNYHTVLIARNYEGVKEINTLLDKSTQEDHFYYKNRITFDEFKNISDNVIKISACLASPLNKLRDESLIPYYDYLEVQPHVNSEEQKEYNQWLYQMSIKYNKPLIAGTDTHSLDNYKAACRSILQKAKHIIFTNEDEFDLTYKSYDELVQMFKAQNSLPEEVYLEAIENTNKMADSVETFVLDKSFKYAKCYDNDEAVLKQRVNEGYRDKLRRGVIKKNPQYAANVKEEFRVFKKIGMLGFMLFMSDLVRWCWANGIPIGYCRGSVGGSTIAYLTDIIDVDPIVWHTVFSRFANEDRKELGDIDIDISPTQRHLVYEHIIDSFGVDYTAYILAIGTISDKGTIDEIGRALDYPLDYVANIKRAYEADAEKAKQDYPELFYYFDGLLNTAISQSMHPAGIIVSPITLPDNYGTFWADGKRILQINMEECHEVSLNKYDLLGLKNVEIIKDTCALAGIPYPKSNEINWNDEKVWADIVTSPAGIFQFEGDYAFKMLQSFQPHKINDMSLVNAALRPSGASYRDRLLAHEINHNPSEIIDDLLKDNFGFLVFQEDTIAFLQKICGLSGSEADNIRRAIGRKQKDRLEKAMPSILEGYCSKSSKPRNVAEEEAKAFLQIIEDSSNYQFGFNHSTGYSMIGYTCAYMRYYYPKQFIAAYLNNANNEDDIVNGTNLAQSKGIEILPAKFGHSKDIYLPDEKDNKIYKGVASIKFLNSDVANALYDMKGQNFDSFIDVIKVFPGNSRQLDILIKLSYFEEFGSIGTLLREVEMYNNYGGKKLLKKDKCNLPSELLSKYCTETEKQWRVQDQDGLIKELCGMIPKNCSVPLQSIFQWQQEYLGYISYKDETKKNVGYVLSVNTKYSPKITVYTIDKGTTEVYKMPKKSYEKQPFNQGCIINFNWEQRPKSKLVDGQWQKDYSVMEKWIINYILNVVI